MDQSKDDSKPTSVLPTVVVNIAIVDNALPYQRVDSWEMETVGGPSGNFL